MKIFKNFCYFVFGLALPLIPSFLVNFYAPSNLHGDTLLKIQLIPNLTFIILTSLLIYLSFRRYKWFHLGLCAALLPLVYYFCLTWTASHTSSGKLRAVDSLKPSDFQ